MAISNLFYWSYWFNQPYIARGWVMWVWVGGFLGLVLAGIVLRVIAQMKKDHLIKAVLRRFSNVGFTMGILGLLWMFLRQQRIQFLAWRFWLLIWAVILIWWMVNLIKYVVKRMPEIAKEKADRLERQKYLPKRG